METLLYVDQTELRLENVIINFYRITDIKWNLPATSLKNLTQ